MSAGARRCLPVPAGASRCVGLPVLAVAVGSAAEPEAVEAVEAESLDAAVAGAGTARVVVSGGRVVAGTQVQRVLPGPGVAQP